MGDGAWEAIDMPCLIEAKTTCLCPVREIEKYEPAFEHAAPPRE
jgi:hypothetical protein